MSTTAHHLPLHLLALAGYRVEEDPDQPGLFAWTRIQGGRTVEGCDASLEDPDLAWEQVRQRVAGLLDDEGVPAQAWNDMLSEQQECLIIEYLGQAS